jgi:hypothetical protein
MDKRQLQKMLREMKVSYSQEATEEELAELIKQENRRQWTKASALREVKTRKKSEKRHAAPSAEGSKPRGLRPKPGAVVATGVVPAGLKLTHRGMIQKRAAAPRTPELDPQKAQGGSTPLESVGACDLCAKPARESGETLAPYSFTDQPALRNTVFLCPGCIETVKTQVDGRDIRALKRKARMRASSSLQVTYGKVKHTWGGKP